MNISFILSPRYRLDDESPWLEGIDPSRNYWLHINGDKNCTVAIPGVGVGTIGEWKQNIRNLRSLQPGETMAVERVVGAVVIHGVGSNCYAIAGEVAGAAVWHLFDQETIESLLMTSHPDWICATKDLDLGRRMLAKSLSLVAA